uniref:Aquaporin-9 n=1 Tax=Globodera pallida TaxID=36090 RepID=A0A183CKS1_GLOPA
MERFREKLAAFIRTENLLLRETLAEFVGTFFLLLIGISANIQSFPHNSVQFGPPLAWGLGLAFGIYTSAQISGGHLNPAISLAELINGSISPGRFVSYFPAQLLGAFVGSAVAFLGHFENCQQIRMANVRLFATYPSSGLSVWGSIADQLIGTAILAFCISLVTDKRNRVPVGLVPLLVGLCLTMIALTFGTNGAFAINPARDLGPRLFVLCLERGWEVFSNNNFYFWVPLVVPFVGAPIGYCLYKLIVGVHGLQELIEISGAKYPRDDRGYKEYNSNPTAIGASEQLVGFSSRKELSR